MIDHTSACQILDTGRCTCRQDTYFNANPRMPVEYSYGHICGPGCPWWDQQHAQTAKSIDDLAEPKSVD